MGSRGEASEYKGIAVPDGPHGAEILCRRSIEDAVDKPGCRVAEHERRCHWSAAGRAVAWTGGCCNRRRAGECVGALGNAGAQRNAVPRPIPGAEHTQADAAADLARCEIDRESGVATHSGNTVTS